MNIFRPILAILVLFIPLYPKFPLTNFQNTYVALRIDDIVIALSVLVWFIYQVKNKFPILKNKIYLLFLAYFVAIIASTLNAIFVYQTDPTNILFLHLFRRFQYISIFFITLEAIKNKTDIKFPYIFLLISIIGIAIYGYGQKYLQFPVISTMNEEFSKGQLLQMNVWTRISSTFAGHYDLAAYLSLILIIIISVISLYPKKLISIFSIPLFLIGFHLLTLTASRVSIFAFWGGSLISLFLIRKYWWIIPVSALVLLSVFTSQDLNQRLIATISSLKPKIPTTTPAPLPTAVIPTIVTPIVTTKPIIIKITPLPPTPTVVRHGPTDEVIPVDIDVGVARSGEIRFNVEWPRAITAFRKNLLNGTGLGSITLATDNDYLRLLGETGILGFLTFLFIPIFLLSKSFSLIFKKSLTLNEKNELLFVGVIICALTNAIFIDIFEASKVAYTFWIIMGTYFKIIWLNRHNRDQ
jgi:hypothetical protein